MHGIQHFTPHKTHHKFLDFQCNHPHLIDASERSNLFRLPIVALKNV